MASEVKRYITGDLKPAGVYAGGSSAEMSRKAVVVLAEDHDRVVAELRSHVRTDNSAVIAGLQEQMAEARELLQAASTLFSPACTDSTQRDWMQRIDTWLEKTK